MTRRRLAIVIAAVAISARAADAQEFVRQVLFVAPMRAGDVATEGTAARVTEELRSQIARLAPKRSLDVPDDDALFIVERRTGFRLRDGDELGMIQALRADEVVRGDVTRLGGEIVVRASLTLVRDARQREPLPVARGVTADAAARAVARSVTAVRAEMSGVRRCENARRDGNFAAAAAAAMEAIRAYPGALARTCLLISLTYLPTPADSLRRAADAVLAVDSTSIIATVERAEALQAAARTTEAVAAWQRVVLLSPDSVDLGLRAIDALLRMKSYTFALDMSRALARHHQSTLSFNRLSFRSLIALGRWHDAVQIGDSLIGSDTAFASDSSYTVRHIEAMRLDGDTLGALAASTRAVRRHPGDARLYLQYLQLVSGEASAALPRGLVRFPEAPEFYVLQSREARAAGRRQEAITAAEAALRRDPTMLQMYFQVADLWLDALHPDSAFDALDRAPREGDAAAAVRIFALSRGSRLLRAADTSVAMVRSAVPFLELADSLQSADDSRALRTAASLQLARGELLVAGRTHACPDARRADDALGAGRLALSHGITAAASGTQLQESYDAMRAAADAALRIYCKVAGSVP